MEPPHPIRGYFGCGRSTIITSCAGLSSLQCFSSFRPLSPRVSFRLIPKEQNEVSKITKGSRSYIFRLGYINHDYLSRRALSRSACFSFSAAFSSSVLLRLFACLDTNAESAPQRFLRTSFRPCHLPLQVQAFATFLYHSLRGNPRNLTPATRGSQFL